MVFWELLKKLNDNKCHLTIVGDKSTEATVTIGNSKIHERVITNC